MEGETTKPEGSGPKRDAMTLWQQLKNVLHVGYEKRAGPSMMLSI